jgi:hypothetical protein
MKAMTIQNPYSHLIITPQEQLPDGAIRKRVENRSWIPQSVMMRVPFAIHAGVSMDWFRFGDWPLELPRKAKLSDVPQMAFGAVVGVAEIVQCFHVNQIRTGQVPAEYQWLCDHKHVSGPYCFVLDNVVALEHPVKCVGQQKFFTLPSSVEARVMEQIGVLA